MLTRAQIIWATAYVLSMDQPIANDVPIVAVPEDSEEVEENEPDG